MNAASGRSLLFCRTHLQRASCECNSISRTHSHVRPRLETTGASVYFYMPSKLNLEEQLLRKPIDKADASADEQNSVPVS
jgi:hypothetical protein